MSCVSSSLSCWKSDLEFGTGNKKAMKIANVIFPRFFLSVSKFAMIFLKVNQNFNASFTI